MLLQTCSCQTRSGTWRDSNEIASFDDKLGVNHRMLEPQLVSVCGIGTNCGTSSVVSNRRLQSDAKGRYTGIFEHGRKNCHTIGARLFYNEGYLRLNLVHSKNRLMPLRESILRELLGSICAHGQSIVVNREYADQALADAFFVVQLQAATGNGHCAQQIAHRCRLVSA